VLDACRSTSHRRPIGGQRSTTRESPHHQGTAKRKPPRMAKSPASHANAQRAVPKTIARGAHAPNYSRSTWGVVRGPPSRRR
jgi:hypothetical protein